MGYCIVNDSIQSWSLIAFRLRCNRRPLALIRARGAVSLFLLADLLALFSRSHRTREIDEADVVLCQAFVVRECHDGGRG